MNTWQMQRRDPKGRRTPQGKSGQTLVELALVLPILIMLLMGLLDLGRLFFIRVALEDSAGEGALQLAIEPQCRVSTDGPHCADPNNAEYRTLTAGGGLVDWSAATVTIDRPTLTQGDVVTVAIEYPFQLLTPLISGMIGADTLTVSGQANEMILTTY